MKLLIPASVTITFDPSKLPADPVARLIWLCWRPHHIVGEGFDECCAAIAKRIENSNPQNAVELAKCFYPNNHHFPQNDVNAWIDQFYLYWRGYATLRVIVKIADGSQFAYDDARNIPHVAPQSETCGCFGTILCDKHAADPAMSAWAQRMRNDGRQAEHGN